MLFEKVLSTVNVKSYTEGSKSFKLGVQMDVARAKQFGRAAVRPEEVCEAESLLQEALAI